MFSTDVKNNNMAQIYWKWESRALDGYQTNVDGTAQIIQIFTHINSFHRYKFIEERSDGRTNGNANEPRRNYEEEFAAVRCVRLDIWQIYGRIVECEIQCLQIGHDQMIAQLFILMFSLDCDLPNFPQNLSARRPQQQYS